MHGIKTYNPCFYQTVESFLINHRAILLTLIGCQIKQFWVMWDEVENEWFADGPVVLEISNKRFEFCCTKLSDFSLTLNSFGLNEPIDWCELTLVWKMNGLKKMTRNLDKEILTINIISYHSMLTGIEFILKKDSTKDSFNYFTITNGLDENALDICEVQNKEHQIKRVNILQNS